MDFFAFAEIEKVSTASEEDLSADDDYPLYDLQSAINHHAMDYIDNMSIIIVHRYININQKQFNLNIPLEIIHLFVMFYYYRPKNGLSDRRRALKTGDFIEYKDKHQHFRWKMKILCYHCGEWMKLDTICVNKGYSFRKVINRRSFDEYVPFQCSVLNYIDQITYDIINGYFRSTLFIDDNSSLFNTIIVHIIIQYYFNTIGQYTFDDSTWRTKLKPGDYIYYENWRKSKIICYDKGYSNRFKMKFVDDTNYIVIKRFSKRLTYNTVKHRVEFKRRKRKKRKGYF
eukprot:370372_1